MLSNPNKKIKPRRAFEEAREKAVKFWQENEREIILAAGVFLALLIAFGSGILVGNFRPKEPLTVKEPAVAEEISSLRGNLKIFNESAPEIKKPEGRSTGSTGSPQESSGQEKFVASKNGGYYYPIGCAAANKIKEANKIFFSSKEAAEQKGLKPSAYCKF